MSSVYKLVHHELRNDRLVIRGIEFSQGIRAIVAPITMRCRFMFKWPAPRCSIKGMSRDSHITLNQLRGVVTKHDAGTSLHRSSPKHPSPESIGLTEFIGQERIGGALKTHVFLEDSSQAVRYSSE